VGGGGYGGVGGAAVGWVVALTGLLSGSG